MRKTAALANTVFYPFRFFIPYLFVWWLFSGNQGWFFGLPAAVSAAVLAVWLGLKPWHIRLRFLPSFVFFFSREVFTGAWDVALRTLNPARSLDPNWLSYDLTSRNSRARLLCSAVLGLMPGTIASAIEGNRMRVHVLNRQLAWQDTVRQLEVHLDRLLGEKEESN